MICLYSPGQTFVAGILLGLGVSLGVCIVAVFLREVRK